MSVSVTKKETPAALYLQKIADNLSLSTKGQVSLSDLISSMTSIGLKNYTTSSQKGSGTASFVNFSLDDNHLHIQISIPLPKNIRDREKVQQLKSIGTTE